MSRTSGRDRRGVRLGLLLLPVLGIALVVAAAVVLLSRRQPDWEAALEQKIAEIRASGQPFTWQEVLEAREMPPDDENSALVLLEAFEHLHELQPDVFAPGSKDALVYPPDWAGGARPSEERLSLLADYVDANSEALELIEDAAKLPGGAYPIDASVRPISLYFDYLADLRESVRVCLAASEYCAATGNATEAANILQVEACLPASLGESVMRIELMTRWACDAIWVVGTQRVLEMTELPAEDLAELRDLAGRERRLLGLRKPLIGDRAWGYDCLVDGAGDPTLVRMIKLRHRSFPGMHERDMLFYVDTMTRAIELCGLPLRQGLAAAAGLDTEVKATVDEGGTGYMGSSYILPMSFESTFREAVRCDARLACLGAATAVEQYRMEHGDWPASLEALVPDILNEEPADPFTGSPLRYVVGEDTAIVYSVGPDGEDDGGLTHRNATEAARETGLRRPERWDETFILLRPDLRGASRRAFREEVFEHDFSVEDLEADGYTAERLRELGLTEEDLRSLGFGD